MTKNDDIKMPDDLPEHAKKFWQLHAANLIADGRLTAVTLPAFVMLCECYDLYRQVRGKNLDTQCRVSASLRGMMNSFYMTPASRSKLKKEEDDTPPWARSKP